MAITENRTEENPAAAGTATLAEFDCPECKAPLELSMNGIDAYRCAGCRAEYPVVQTIPRFVTPDNYAASFGYQWNIHVRTQVDKYSGYRFSHDRYRKVTGWPERMDGERVLEAGCGAGRFTEVLLESGAELWSFDLSSAVTANRSNNGSDPRFHLFQGDMFRLPLREASFDRVFCLGVIQHTPDPRRAFETLVRYVRPGGHIVVDVYKKHWQTRLNTKYLWRALARGMDREKLYRLVERVTPALLRLQNLLRSLIGAKLAFGLVPVSPADLPGLSAKDRVTWSILDTFDMYSPVHDHPQALDTVRGWFADCGLVDVQVGFGPNGINARGRKPD